MASVARIQDPREGDKIRWTERRNGRRQTYTGTVHTAHEDRWLINLGAGRYYNLTRPVWDATGVVVESSRPRLVAVSG
jgi:hypothetical protein